MFLVFATLEFVFARVHLFPVFFLIYYLSIFVDFSRNVKVAEFQEALFDVL